MRSYTGNAESMPIELDIFEIWQVDGSDTERCVAVVMADTEDDEDMSFIHKLTSRQAVEEAIKNLQRAVDILWPVN